jgi:death on curing protein
MPYRKPLDIIYPTTVNVERFHEIVVAQRGSTGYNSFGLVDVGIEWAKHTITYHDPSPGLLARAGALMFAYVNFHAWADGNKRTALMTTAFFFHLNQYGFDITPDSADFTLQVAESWIKNPNALPIEEIGKIVNWLRPRVSPPGLLRGPGRFLVNHTALDEEGWEIALKPWIDRTSRRIELVGLMRPTKVNGASGQTKT